MSSSIINNLVISEKSTYDIVILVIASKGNIYDKLIRKHWIYLIEYMKIFNSNIKCLLIFGKGDLSSLKLNKDDYIQFNTMETLIPGVLHKTMLAFKYVEQNYNYKYIFRTNLSSILVIDNFLKYANNLPTYNVYSGAVGIYEHTSNIFLSYDEINNANMGIKIANRSKNIDKNRRIKYRSGSGFFVSHDNIRKLIENEKYINYAIIDDVAIGDILDMGKSDIENAKRYDMIKFTKFDENEISKHADIAVKSHYHIRVKNMDRNIDIKIFDTFDPLIYRIPYRKLINSLILARNKSDWFRITNLCYSIFVNEKFKYSERELCCILDEYYIACYYTNDKSTCQEIGAYIKNNKILYCSYDPQHLINNFKYINYDLRPIWDTHIVSMFIDIGIRGSDYYFKQTQLFKFDLPMTILVDSKNVNKVPKRKNIRTIVINMEDLINYKFLSRIVENRKIRPSVDTRNTSLSFCLYTSKFEAVLRSLAHIKEEKIVWIDFGLKEQITYQKLMEINNYDINGFRVCLIHYRPKSLVLDRERYYKCGLCCIAAGVMVGRKNDWIKISGLIQIEFEDLVKSGYGHAEEQILKTIYVRHPELFDLYYGDYDILLKNFSAVQEKRDQIVKLILNPLRNDGRKYEAEKLESLLNKMK